jgi:N-acetylglutamate synthase-like GNAT family acetyltransferase
MFSLWNGPVMNRNTIEFVTTSEEVIALEDFLWQILWRPLDLPRDIRQHFKVDGKETELICKDGDLIVGGLVAVWTGENEVELLHIAVRPESQKKGIGQYLVEALIEIVESRRCARIYTIARNTSSGFFQRLGFKKIPGVVPEHQAFKKYGITFELMERIAEPGA